MTDKLTDQDCGPASAALVQWFQSQDLDRNESADLMINLMGFVLATSAGDLHELSRILVETQAALTMKTLEYWEFKEREPW
jgi:hypothetical protein